MIFALIVVSLLGGVDDDELKDLTSIGFQQQQQLSRVFVRTTEPVKFTIDDSKPNIIDIYLSNTRIPLKNNTRALDTSYFSGPVTYIRAKAIEGPSPSVRITIRLRGRAKLTPTQTDTQLALDFAPST